MIEFGQTLKSTREEKGLSQSDIAAKTHMLVQQIDALEKEDFSRIAAPIYGRGFVKLYCEALGLDPKPFVAEFMEIYSGNRPPVIRRRSVETPPKAPPANAPGLVQSEPAPAPAPAQAPEPEIAAPAPAPAASGFAMPEPASEPVPEPEPAPAPGAFSLEQETYRSPIAPTVPEPDPLASARPRPSYSRYATPARDEQRGEMFRIPPVVWRVLLLAGAAVLLLWLLLSGLRALYRTTMRQGDGAEPGEAQTQENTTEQKDTPQPAQPTQQTQPAQTQARPQPQPAATDTPRVKRKPMKIPPLYVD